MSVDREYRIRINTIGDPSGAQVVAGALDKTTGSTQEATKAAEKHTVGMHAMHRVFHALNEVVPGLGVVMQAAFSSVGAAISLAVMALSLFREHMKKVNEEMDKMEAEAAKPLTNRLEIMRESVIRNAASMTEMALKTEDATRAQRTLATAIEEVISRMREENKERESLAGIGNKAELAALENLHKAGLVSEQQYAAERLRIEQELVEKKRKLAEDELQAEINIRKEGAKAAHTQQGELAPGVESARQKNETAQTNKLAAESEMEIAKENAKAAAEAVKQWAAKHSEFSMGQALHAAVFGGSGAEEAKKDIAEYQRLQGVAARTKADVEKEPAKVAKAQTAATAAADDWKLALEKLSDATKLEVKLKEEAAQKERELAARKTANAATTTAEHQAAGLSGPLGMAATEDVSGASQTALQYDKFRQRKGSEPSRDQEQALIDVATRISGHKVSLAQAVAIMEPAATNIQAFTDDAMKLATVMGNIARFLGKYQTSQVQLDSIAAQVKALEANPTTRTMPGG